MESIRFEDDATKQHLLHFASTSNKNNRGNPRLHNNPAKKLLELDVAAGRANGRKPAELKKDRPEYEQFETIQFCKAVNNERQKQRCEEFWAPKRNKEGALRNILRREKQLQDLGMIQEQKIMQYCKDVIALYLQDNFLDKQAHHLDINKS